MSRPPLEHTDKPHWDATRDERHCSPGLTECPRCHNKLADCDGLFATRIEERPTQALVEIADAEQYKSVLSLAEILVAYDPAPGTYACQLLVDLAAAIEQYERKLGC